LQVESTLVQLPSQWQMGEASASSRSQILADLRSERAFLRAGCGA
jgi:hypothetical protein